MQEKEHDNLVLSIGRLEGKMDGVITQMSIANGRTSKNEAKIDMIEKRQDKQEGAFKTINIFWGAFIGLGGLIIAAISLWIK